MAYVKIDGKNTYVDSDDEAAALISSGVATPADDGSSSSASTQESQPALRAPGVPMADDTPAADSQPAPPSDSFANPVTGEPNPDTSLDLSKEVYKATPANWLRAIGDVTSGVASVAFPAAAAPKAVAGSLVVPAMTIARPIIANAAAQVPATLANLVADFYDKKLQEDPTRTIAHDIAPLGIAGASGLVSGLASRYLKGKATAITDPGVQHLLERGRDPVPEGAVSDLVVAKMISPEEDAKILESAAAGDKNVIHVIDGDALKQIAANIGAVTGTTGHGILGGLAGGVLGYGAGKALGAGVKGINDWAIKNPGAVEGAAKVIRNTAGVPAAGIDLYNLYEAMKKSNGNYYYKKSNDNHEKK